jgi:hypothetical protein
MSWPLFPRLLSIIVFNKLSFLLLLLVRSIHWNSSRAATRAFSEHNPPALYAGIDCDALRQPLIALHCICTLYCTASIAALDMSVPSLSCMGHCNPLFCTTSWVYVRSSSRWWRCAIGGWRCNYETSMVWQLRLPSPVYIPVYSLSAKLPKRCMAGWLAVSWK